MLKNIALIAVASIVIAISGSTAEALTIDFGTSWPVYNPTNYSSDPLNRVLGVEDGQHSTESELAAVINTFAGTSFTAGDILKFGATEVNGPDGYFLAPAGYTYLAVQYDGPNGGSVVIKLDGNAATIPYDSSLIWGTGDKHAVSHFAVAGPTSVPDGGATVMLLGLALGGLGTARRHFVK